MLLGNPTTLVNRFSKVLLLLVVALFIVVSGLNRALDDLAKSPTQSSFTIYNLRGCTLLTYNGDLAQLKNFVKPATPAPNLPRRG